MENIRTEYFITGSAPINWNSENYFFLFYSFTKFKTYDTDHKMRSSCTEFLKNGKKPYYFIKKNAGASGYYLF